MAACPFLQADALEASDVGTGDECLVSRARHDQHTRVGLGAHLIDGSLDGDEHLYVECVEHCRSLNRQRRYRSIVRELNDLILGHTYPFRCAEEHVTPPRKRYANTPSIAAKVFAAYRGRNDVVLASSSLARNRVL